MDCDFGVAELIKLGVLLWIVARVVGAVRRGMQDTSGGDGRRIRDRRVGAGRARPIPEPRPASDSATAPQARAAATAATFGGMTGSAPPPSSAAGWGEGAATDEGLDEAEPDEDEAEELGAPDAEAEADESGEEGAEAEEVGELTTTGEALADETASVRPELIPGARTFRQGEEEAEVVRWITPTSGVGWRDAMMLRVILSPPVLLWGKRRHPPAQSLHSHSEKFP